MSELLPVQKRVANVRALLEKAKPQIAMALPKHLDPDRMLRIAMTSVQRVPKLLDCDPVSLIGAVIQSAQLGLEPDGVLGHAYLIPYGKQVQFQTGYKGLLMLARRSGEISSVETRVVYEKDRFEYAFGLKPDLTHVPTQDEDAGEVMFVYAIVRLKDGAMQWDVMSKGQIEVHRRRYARATSGDTPWQTAWEEMAKKTVLKRVLKLAPASVELQRAIALDEHAEAGLAQDLTAVALAAEVPVAPDAKAGSKLDSLTDRLALSRYQRSAETDPEADRFLALGTIDKLHEDLKSTDAEKEQLWREFCGEATPVNADIAALIDLQGALQHLVAEKGVRAGAKP